MTRICVLNLIFRQVKPVLFRYGDLEAKAIFNYLTVKKTPLTGLSLQKVKTLYSAPLWVLRWDPIIYIFFNSSNVSGRIFRFGFKK